MEKKQFQKALHVYQTIVDEELGSEQIFALIKQAYCHIGMKKSDEILKTTYKISGLIQSQLKTDELQQIGGQCDTEIEQLIMKLIDIEEVRSALLLLDCRIELIQQIYLEESKMCRLEKTGNCMLEISKTMAQQNRKHDFKKQHSFMDKVGTNIRLISDVDVNDRCRYAVSFFLNYGLCCFNVEDYKKSMELFKEAIHMLELVFADRAIEFQLFGQCHNHLGLVYEHLQMPNEAKKCFDVATNTFDQFVKHSKQNESKKKTFLGLKIINKRN